MNQAPSTKSQEEKSANVSEAGFKKLKIWQKGMEIVQKVYQLKIKFPEEERFCLVAQMRRMVLKVCHSEKFILKGEKHEN